MGGQINTESATTWGLLSWGQGAWGDQNDTSISVTGVASTTAVGSVTIDAEIGEGWGRGTWGNRVWGGAYSVIPTGVSASTAIGTSTVGTTICICCCNRSIYHFSYRICYYYTRCRDYSYGFRAYTGAVGTVDFDGDATTGSYKV